MNLSIILDNAGGLVLKAGNWAGYWSAAQDAAETLADLLDGADPELEGWVSDEDALDVECSMEQIARGGCQQISCADWDEVLALLDPESGWTSEKKLRAALLAIRASE